MVDCVRNVGYFAPTRTSRPPQEIMRERNQKIQRQRMNELYDDLSDKEKNGAPMTDMQKMQLYFLKALKIAEKLPSPVVMYEA